MKLNVEIRFNLGVIFGLVHFLHPGGVLGVTLERRHVGVVTGGGHVIRALVLLVDAETQLDHPVDPLGVDSGVLQAEAGAEERGLEEKEHQVLHRLVVLVRLRPLPQVLHNVVVWVDLEVLLGGHVAHGRGVPQCLRLHDALHVSRPAVLHVRISLFGNHKTI